MVKVELIRFRRSLLFSYKNKKKCFFKKLYFWLIKVRSVEEKEVKFKEKALIYC